VLRVLAKATQDRPEDRYQTVEAFWDDLSEASLPQTLPLKALPEGIEARRKPSEDLVVEDERFTEPVPPRAHFAPATITESMQSDLDIQKRPRIVVPITAEERQQLKRRRGVFPRRKVSPSDADLAKSESVLPPSRSIRAIVALALILAFAGMLLATHKYVTSRWNPLSTIPKIGDTFIVGREGVTTTDVKLRPEAGTTRPEIGLAEIGSKVKVLSVDNNWYEVEVIQHGRPKADPYSSDRGWLNKRYVEFD
jgi:hypothetical protein